MGAGFVWDDVPLIVQNHALNDVVWTHYFTDDLWADSGAGQVASGYYRPLVLLSFAFDRAVFGLDPLGYHVHSLVWHLIAVCGLHRLMMPLVGVRGALMGAAVFALHPVQSEVVSWVAARNDLMAAAFGFAALNLIWSRETPSRSALVLSMICTIMAALSKETAFVLPGLFWVASGALGCRSEKGYRVFPLVIGVLFVLGLRYVVDVGQAVVPDGAGWRLLGESSFSLAGIFAASIVTPWPISSARDLAWIDLVPFWRIAVGWVFIGVLVWLWRSSDRRQVVGMGLAWALLLSAVTWVAIADKGGFGDRFLYWPMAGMAVVIGASLTAQFRWFIPVYLIMASVTIHFKLPDWKHDRALWGAAIRDVSTPTNAVSLGHALTLHQRHKRAHVSFVGAMAGQRIDVEACPGIVGSAMRAGMTAQALRMGLWAEERGCPPNGSMHGWMATAAAVEGAWDVAEDWAHRVPQDPRKRDVVVRAAIAKRNGDVEAFQRHLSEWDGADPLEPQVDGILSRDDDR
jgi:hypothetical protein